MTKYESHKRALGDRDRPVAPQLGIRLLRRCLPQGELPDLLGDLEELFHARARRDGPAKARRWYVGQVLHVATSLTVEKIRTRLSVVARSGVRRRLPSQDRLPRRKTWLSIHSYWQDVRVALRSLRKRPLFAVVAVLTFGLGIGTSTAMFSVLQGVILYRSPFEGTGQLVTVFTAWTWLRELPGMAGFWDRNPIEIDQYVAWRDNTTQFSDVAVHRVREMTLTGMGEPRREMVGVASASLLRVLGVQPVLGRWFLPGEEGTVRGDGAQVAVIDHAMWYTHFAANPQVVGETLILNDRRFAVVGVLPQGFRLRWLGLPSTENVDTGKKRVWIPLGASGVDPKGGSWEAIGRLHPGVSPQQAVTETRSILMPNTGPDEGHVRVVPRKVADTQSLASPLVLLFGSTGLVLLWGIESGVAVLRFSHQSPFLGHTWRFLDSSQTHDNIPG